MLKRRLPGAPRLKDVELPRTTSQLRQAAAAAREGSWALPTIDTKLNIRSCLASIGPVWVFGPNNFPFAFNSVAGGDFAAAIAAGNPVIAKANTSHPGTTRRVAELAQQAAEKTEMPSGTVQLIYRTSHADGLRLVADARTGATGYTGSRHAGLALKAAADAAGKPIYLELSSINPVVILPGAICRAGRKDRRGIHDELLDGDRSVLHQSRLGADVGRAKDRRIHSECRSAIQRLRRLVRCFRGEWRRRWARPLSS